TPTSLLGDVNGDQRADLVYERYDTRLGLILDTQLSNGDGTYRSREQVQGNGNGWLAYGRLVGDFNGDGKADLVYQGYDSQKGLILDAKLSNGDGTFPSRSQVLGDGNGVLAYPTLVGDFNGDGKADLFYQYYDSSAGVVGRVKFSNGDGTW